MPEYQILNIALKEAVLNTNKASSFFFERKEQQNNIRFQMNVAELNKEESLFEVSFQLVIQGLQENAKKLDYEAMVGYAAIIKASGFTQEDFDKLIGVHVATALYPYCRSKMQQIIGETQFNISNLPTIDFSAVHEEQQQAKQEQKNQKDQEQEQEQEQTENQEQSE